jgi:hypothetical protein
MVPGPPPINAGKPPPITALPSLLLGSDSRSRKLGPFDFCACGRIPGLLKNPASFLRSRFKATCAAFSSKIAFVSLTRRISRESKACSSCLAPFLSSIICCTRPRSGEERATEEASPGPIGPAYCVRSTIPAARKLRLRCSSASLRSSCATLFSNVIRSCKPRLRFLFASTKAFAASAASPVSRATSLKAAAASATVLLKLLILRTTPPPATASISVFTLFISLEVSLILS